MSRIQTLLQEVALRKQAAAFPAQPAPVDPMQQAEVAQPAPVDPRMQQAEDRLAEAKIAKTEAKADGGDVAVQVEQQKTGLAKDQLMMGNQRGENARLKLEIEGDKLRAEKQRLEEEKQQALAAQQQMQQQQMAQAQAPDPENTMQQVAQQQQQQAAMPKVAGAAPYYFGLPNLYSLNMFQPTR